ncbi:MAG: PhzF family phenazine biosynthesis protein [Actinomycetia bacterium]|nr:PhzF family phenazine biosynthesis protein [Actinomycetes bacterium]
MTARDFRQVDVFTAEPYRGNPVAVVLDGDGLSEEQMAAFARWTNLSETTFVRTPTTPEADYRLRIFTPGGELPFAGHPTLGSAHAWLESGRTPRGGDTVVQECGLGLVRLRRDGDRLAFAAPDLLRSGAVDAETQTTIARALRLDQAGVRAYEWIDNGPGWVGVLLDSADAVLALEPDFAAFEGLKIGVVGPYSAGEFAYEVRAFAPSLTVGEDPVTGSLNAGVGQWLIGTGIATERYVASQGTRLQRAGRVHVESVGGQVWVGGASTTCIAGQVEL